MPKAHQARKRFGQNFLHNQHVVDRIVSAIAPQPGERIIEIGPGLGALTLPILTKVRQMTAIELDRDIIPKLTRACSGAGELEIVSADVLQVDFHQFAKGDQKVRIIGNLPYNISTPLLFHLMPFHAMIQDMHFMLQKEVVQRLAAEPNTKQYGRLSVMIQFYCKVEPLFIVPPGAFDPAPKVDSMIVRLTPKNIDAYDVAFIQKLEKLVQLAFSQRRKTLANNLKGHMDRAAIESCGIDPTRRAETLLLAEFIALTKHF